MRPHWPQRLSGQVLMVQLAITTGVVVLAISLFTAPLARELDEEAMHRALAIAQTTAADPSIAQGLLTTRPTPDGPVQRETERIRRATGALYVVTMDMRGVRWSHTTTAEIGRHVSTDPSDPLAGREIKQIDSGTLGRSARAKVPLYDGSGDVVGAVSVGIAYDSVRHRLIGAIPALLLCAAAALAVGAGVAFAVSRRLRRRTHGIAFSDISALLDEREAMLHGIREGVIAFDPRGRIRLVNDEAARLLGLDIDMTDYDLDAVMPAGRTADVLAGRVEGADLLTVSGGRVLVVNRMPTADGGAVVTLRDRTELELLGRELDSTQGLLEALRAQGHEHANRLHTVLGLLELRRYEQAADYVTHAVGDHRSSAEEIAERVHDPLVSALLVGKAVVAAERAVELRVRARTRLPDRLVAPRDLVTVLGNLIDNALDAAAEKHSADSFVEVELWAEDATVLLQVCDTGPGVPPEAREAVFTEGYSTKAPARTDVRPQPARTRGPLPHGRGIGLSLVRRLAERYGGTARVTARSGGGAVFTVILPEMIIPGVPGDLPGAGTGEPSGTGLTTVGGAR